MRFLKPHYSHFLKVRSRVLQGRPVFVFMYHRIDDHADKHLSKLTVSVRNFEEQLIYFGKKYDFFRLTDDWQTKKKPGAVLTFDDGYAKTLLYALPLLEKYNIPVTLFITTQNIGSEEEFWWDRLAFDYSSCNDLYMLPDIGRVTKSDFTYKAVSHIIAKLKNEEKKSWFLAFEEANDIHFENREEYRALSSEELTLLANHPLVDIGLHSHHHYPFSDLSNEELRSEVQLSIENLDRLVPKNCRFLALPHGSYNSAILGISRELGLKGILLANDNFSNATNKLSGKINRIIIPDIKGQALADYLTQFELTFMPKFQYKRNSTRKLNPAIHICLVAWNFFFDALT